MYSSKPMIFVVISVIVVALVYNSSSTSNVFVQGKPVAGGHIDCNLGEIYGTITCCWYEEVVRYGILTSKYVCQTCTEDGTNCGPIEDWRANKGGDDVTGPLEKEGVLQPLTPPRSVPPTVGENILQQDLEVLEQTPSQGLPPLKQGQGVLPQDGVLEQAPADQGAAELPPTITEETQPAIVEEEPSAPVCQGGLEFNEDLGFCVPEDCPEGQVLDEESGICVLEEPETAEEEPAQSDPEEEQPPEESDGSEDNSGDN
ncbi:MAG: hypothetical protein GEU26_12790 [Nitrososphaeraceae archaeon]|nr:hypothetical protein [Nitrososphaeraceae archaeon]